jgi:hypothetical protein
MFTVINSRCSHISNLSLGSFRLEMLEDAASEPCADRNVGSLTEHVPG